MQQNTLKHKPTHPPAQNGNPPAGSKKGYKLTKLGWIPVEWELLPVKCFGKVITGSTPKTNNPEFYQGDLPFVSPTDLNGTKYIAETEKRLSKEGFETGRKIKKGSVLFVSIGSTIGKTAIAGRELITNQQINSVVPSKTNSGEFVFYQLSFHSERFKKIAGNQAVPILNKSTFQDIEIVRPPLPEQKRIAEILSTWDKAIAKTEKLISQKQQHKKALMQQLLTGKWRFKEFVKSNKMKETKLGMIPEDWEVGQLRELCITFKSGMGITSKNIYEFGRYAVYGGNGLRGFTNQFTHEGVYFLIGRQGALCGNIVKISGKNYVSEHAIAVRTNSENDNNFLAYKLDYINLNRLSESSAQPGLSVEKLSKLKISTPPLPEQRKIASVLSAADQEIAVLQNELEKLKEQKKGLMQKLLTGEVRVKV